jgi:hypothetical protein
MASNIGLPGVALVLSLLGGGDPATTAVMHVLGALLVGAPMLAGLN